MIRALLLSVAVCLSTAAYAEKLQPFSAEIVTTGSSTPDKAVTAKLFSAGTKLRMEVMGNVMIMDLTAKKSFMLMPAQKMAMEIPLQANANAPKPMIGDNPCSFDPSLSCKDLGSEKMGGRAAHKWQVTQKTGSVSTVWVDNKIGFPLKTESKEVKSELKNIKEGAQAAELFEIPKDYQMQQMPAMPGMPGAGQ